ncbi:hypothetical protein lerEdw1_020928 [Lerista edwardsae]|nr:hypothetical protein lerEdw1_020928 [Lerista edwardsae]
MPSCSPPISYPVGGLGSLSSCAGIGYPSGALSLGGLGLGLGGGAASASSLGILAGANVGCVNQLPPSECVIQPAPCVVTLPGPIISASCEPAKVGGYSACGGGGSSGALLSSGSGLLGSGLLGSRRGLICRPC